MLDTGSTTAYVARALADHKDLLVVTNCTDIAASLAGRNRVYLAGGELRADDGAVFGASTMAFVEQFRVRYAVLSIGAIAGEDGLMDFHLQEAEFSRAVMARASRTMVVADHTKFGMQAPVRVCGFEAIDLLITDRAPDPEIAMRIREAGTELQITE
jgi:DeoR family glycerol-3-phosphate regulon repressor